MEVLAESQVALGGLDRGVAERELDLLERGAALVGELGEGAPQVVRRDFTEAGLAGMVFTSTAARKINLLPSNVDLPVEGAQVAEQVASPHRDGDNVIDFPSVVGVPVSIRHE